MTESCSILSLDASPENWYVGSTASVGDANPYISIDAVENRSYKDCTNKVGSISFNSSLFN